MGLVDYLGALPVALMGENKKDENVIVPYHRLLNNTLMTINVLLFQFPLSESQVRCLGVVSDFIYN